ncbi:MAG TPA: replicative DNA helicase [Bacteroidetes bacterium]|nr:MAG: replicative DNA helicase [Bacteroidota bacterium]RLD74524.1 MAG: replicative DNA helicase [Bacteroidota bacterium]HHL57834.1 replicative DNA helicase [Bacteroidota bacterium]
MEEAAKNLRKKSTVKKTPDISSVVLEHGKVPPQAIDLEEAVLGAMMLEKDAVTSVIDILSPKVFYVDKHQRIFAAVQSLFTKSEPIDILTVTNELKSTGELEMVGGPYYITSLTSRIASAANIEFHARILLQKHIQRELITISTEIINDAYEDTTDVFNLLDKAEQNLFAVSETNLRRNFEDMPSLIQQAIKDIESAKDSENKLRGVPSGFTALDRITSGWQKSDLIILAARPSMGKTALALTMARNVAVDFNQPIAFFSLEMSSVQLVTRLISSETELKSDKLKRGDLAGHEWQQLNDKIANLVDAKIFIDDTPALTIFELRAKCRRLKQQHNIQMVFVDYLQLMSGGGDNKGNREQEISQISRSLKALAKELDVPVLALSQLSRAVENRPGQTKRPILSDLRESGAIEQDADLVLFIYRPEYYKLDEFEDGSSTHRMAEVIIAKHRNGPTGDVKLRFIDTYAKFEDTDRGSDYSLSDVNAGIKTLPSKLNDMTDTEGEPF